MNFSPIQNVLSTTLTYFEDQIIRPLTAQQKKIALIALAIFSALATSYVIYRRCFKAEKIDSDQDDGKVPTPNNPKKSPENTDKVDPKKSPERPDKVDPKKSPEKLDKVDPKKSPEKLDKVDSDKPVDPEFEKAKEEISKDGRALERYPQYQDNDSLVALAIKTSKGWALEFAKAFQADEKMVDLSVEGNPYAVQFASEEYRGNFDKMAALVKIKGLIVQYATDELRTTSRPLAKLAVESDGLSLEFLEAFNDDDEIVEIAIGNAPKAIKFASERIQKLKAELVEAKEEKLQVDPVKIEEGEQPKTEPVEDKEEKLQVVPVKTEEAEQKTEPVEDKDEKLQVVPEKQEEAEQKTEPVEDKKEEQPQQIEPVNKDGAQ